VVGTSRCAFALVEARRCIAFETSMGACNEFEGWFVDVNKAFIEAFIRGIGI